MESAWLFLLVWPHTAFPLAKLLYSYGAQEEHLYLAQKGTLRAKPCFVHGVVFNPIHSSGRESGICVCRDLKAEAIRRCLTYLPAPDARFSLKPMLFRKTVEVLQWMERRVSLKRKEEEGFLRPKKQRPAVPSSKQDHF